MSPRPDPLYLALEIGGSKIQVCVGNEVVGIIDRQRFVVDRACGGEGIRVQIASALPALIARHAPVALGVGYGGPVASLTGRTIKSYHIAGWDDYPLGEWLQGQTGLPCFVENDTNTAAFGEATLGAGRVYSPVFYTNLGSGVGGGLVVRGDLYHGAPPGEVEFGHLRLDPSGTIVEDHCSGWAVDRALRAEAVANPGGLLAQLLGKSAPGGEARHLAAALALSDEPATRILQSALHHLAFALSHVVQLFHPALIIIGGGLAQLGEPLRRMVEEALPPFVMDALLPPPAIRLAELGEDAVPMGCLALAAQRRIASP